MENLAGTQSNEYPQRSKTRNIFRADYEHSVARTFISYLPNMCI